MTTETIQAEIHGLNCSNCAANVERSISDLTGVSEAQVEFETESAMIRHDPHVASIERIAYAVEHACSSRKRRFTISVDGHQIAGSRVSASADDGDERREDWP